MAGSPLRCSVRRGSERGSPPGKAGIEKIGKVQTFSDFLFEATFATESPGYLHCRDARSPVSETNVVGFPKAAAKVSGSRG
jgi:hypothetical protein